MQLPAYELKPGDVIHGHVGHEPFAHPMLVLGWEGTMPGNLEVTYQRDGGQAFARAFDPHDHLQVTRPAHHTEAGCALVEHAGGWYGVRMDDGFVTTGPWPTLEHARRMATQDPARGWNVEALTVPTYVDAATLEDGVTGALEPNDDDGPRYSIVVEGTFRAVYSVRADTPGEATASFQMGQHGDAELWEVIDSHVTDIQRVGVGE